MPNTELPMDLESQVVLMKKYITFRQRKKMREFLGYAGYFRASRYGKFLLTQVNAFGSKADSKVFFELYDFDVQLRLLLFNIIYNKNSPTPAGSEMNCRSEHKCSKEFYK